MEKGRKILLIVMVVLVFSVGLKLIFNGKAISATIYDSETNEPIHHVTIDVKSSKGDYMFGNYAETESRTYSSSYGKFKLRPTYRRLESISFSKEGYISRTEYNPYGDLKRQNVFYLVPGGLNPLNISKEKISEHIFDEEGRLVLQNGDSIEFSYDFIGEPSTTHMGTSSNRKISYPEGGLIYIGSEGTLFDELKATPPSGYNSGQLDLKIGVYAFQTSDGSYGKLSLHFIEAVDNGKYNLWVVGDYIISPDGINVELLQ